MFLNDKLFLMLDIPGIPGILVFTGGDNLWVGVLALDLQQNIMIFVQWIFSIPQKMFVPKNLNMTLRIYNTYMHIQKEGQQKWLMKKDGKKECLPLFYKKREEFLVEL